MLSNRWPQGTKINFVDVPQLVRFPRALEDQRLPLNGNGKFHHNYKTIPPRFGCKIGRKMTAISRIVELEEKVVKSSSLFVVVVEGLKFGGDPKSFPLKSELSLFKPLCHRV